MQKFTKYIRSSYFFIIFSLLGCQSSQNNLYSMNFTFNSTKIETKDAIVSIFLSEGYWISKDSEYILAFDRPANDFMLKFLFGSKFNGTPNGRIVFTITGNKPTSVNARIQIVTNPGSGFENITDLTDNVEIQKQIAIRIAMAQNKIK